MRFNQSSLTLAAAFAAVFSYSCNPFNPSDESTPSEGRLSGGRGSTARDVREAPAGEKPNSGVPVAETTEVDVPGFERAVVSVPRFDGNGAKPLIVATHGAWDLPEPHCAMWQRIVGDRAFVICPRGRGANRPADGEQRLYYYENHLELTREVESAISAVENQFAGRVNRTQPLYAGFSQGAIHGALLLRTTSIPFFAAVFIEGGFGSYSEWNDQAAKRVDDRGVERVLFVCGRSSCPDRAETSAELLNGRGVVARVEYVEGAGHSYLGPVEDRIREEFTWVVEGAEEWSKHSGASERSPTAIGHSLPEQSGARKR